MPEHSNQLPFRPLIHLLPLLLLRFLPSQRWPLEGPVKATALGAQRLAVHLSMIAIKHPHSWIARFISSPGLAQGEE